PALWNAVAERVGPVLRSTAEGGRAATPLWLPAKPDNKRMGPKEPKRRRHCVLPPHSKGGALEITHGRDSHRCERPAPGRTAKTGRAPERSVGGGPPAISRPQFHCGAA